MNRGKLSKGHSSTATSSSGLASAGEDGEPIRQSRKRAAPSSSTATASTSGTQVLSLHQAVATCNGTSSSTQEYVDMDSPDFMCAICMENMNEPTSTHCGHTYCQSCVNQAIDSNSRCPKCGSHLAKDKLIPNFALSDVMARQRRSTIKQVRTEIYESSMSGFGSPPNDAAQVIASVKLDNLSVNDMDTIIRVFQRRREILACDDQEYKRRLLQEFLSQLQKMKNAHLEQLSREIALINRDLSVMRNSSGSGSLSGADAHASTSKDLKVESCSSSSGIGFNTQPLRSIEMEQQSLAARKKRMYNHFDELTQVYFDSRNSEVFDTRGCDATVPNGHGEFEDSEVLSKFGKTLSHITQYHSLKPLATLSYSADMLSNSNIVSSIEFDKDNEFFAIAGVTKKIKLFEYINVIGSAVDIHCPSAELSCNAKISCVAWSNYYKNNLASSDYEGCVSLWDVATCSRTRNLSEHEKRVWSVDWSNGDPRLLASGSDDSKVKLWSTNSEKSIANLEGKANVCCVKFCPESTYVIAFGSADHCVHYYDFRHSKEPLGVLYGHKKAVSYVKFVSKDELVSASTDSNLKLWCLDDSNCIRSFTGHVNEKNFVGLATDGNYIACGSENNSLYLYHKSLPKPLFSFKFENHRSMLERPKADESPEFVSAVAWKKGSPVVVAANSQGAIKILELV